MLSGRCALNDDFEALAERLRQADRAAFVSPVYLAGPALGLRAFFHRLAGLCRHGRAGRGIRGTPAAIVCIGGGAPACADRLRRMLETCGLDVRDTVTASRPTATLELGAFRAAGKRLAGDGATGPGLSAASPAAPH